MRKPVTVAALALRWRSPGDNPAQHPQPVEGRLFQATDHQPSRVRVQDVLAAP
jgi:hypothetical protein